MYATQIPFCFLIEKPGDCSVYKYRCCPNQYIAVVDVNEVKKWSEHKAAVISFWEANEQTCKESTCQNALILPPIPKLLSQSLAVLGGCTPYLALASTVKKYQYLIPKNNIRATNEWTQTHSRNEQTCKENANRPDDLSLASLLIRLY